ncbi:MAG TPA: protein kinase, partial [Anaeromyxobacteraceae bacterium]|nr:protein kinase [Anaeromyxobacteraceae bacterium]
MPPRTLGAYEILAIVGRGGIGTVYRARHREHGQEVALKLLAPPPACEPTAARRLAREFEALQELDHPNVVRVYEAGVHEGYSFLAMELVEGLDLRSYLSPLLDDDLGGRFPPVPALRAVDLEAWSEEPDTESLFAPVDEHSGTEALRAFATLLEEPETGTGF